MIHTLKEHFWKSVLIVIFILCATQYLTNMMFSRKRPFFFLDISDSDSVLSERLKDAIKNGSFRLTHPSLVKLKNMSRFTQTLSPTQQGATTNSTVRASINSTSSHHTTTQRNLCPILPPGLKGRLPVNLTVSSFKDISSAHPELELGGRWHPFDCESRFKVAIIVPYRNRSAQLKVFLSHMHPFLQRQQLDYGIYIIEQTGGTKFNRAMLMNIGFVESQKLDNYACFFFHDVDLLPEDDRNLYTCPSQPRHLSAAVDKFQYKLPYHTIFGGVSGLTKEQFEAVNGFSNKYFGWGGEDDDMWNRIRAKGYDVIRYPIDIARYKMIRHASDTANPERMKLLQSGRDRFDSDGINSLVYKRVSVTETRLFTQVLVDINFNDVMAVQVATQQRVTVLKRWPIGHT